MVSKPIIYQLHNALSAFESVSWVALTDEYPPYAVGGAEISLHELIKGLGATAQKGLVIKIAAASPKIGFYRLDGINVLTLPRQDSWRTPGMTSGELKKIKDILKPQCLLDSWLISRLFLRYGINQQRIDVIRLWATKSPTGGVLTDSLPEQYALNAELLSEVVRVLRPQVFIANNTRSIVSVYYSKQLSSLPWRGVRTIAMVRDNRFQCPRHNQIMRVANKDCVSCKFECANMDSRKNVQSQVRLLKQTKKIRQTALQSMDTVAVTSNFLRKQIRGLLAQNKPIEVLPNYGGDPDVVFAAVEDVAEKPEHGIAIIGMLNEAKGQLEFLTNSLSQLKSDRRIEIHFFGRGVRLENILRQLVKKHELEKQVLFHGYLSRAQLYAAVRECKVVALPTLWPEPFGRVPLEAALCGRPVVAFCSGGLIELIENEKTGFIVDKADYQMFWRRIHELLDDGELRREIAINARAALQQRYAKSKCTAEFRRLISAVEMETGGSQRNIC